MAKMKFLLDINLIYKQHFKAVEEKLKKLNGDYNIRIMILQGDKTTTNKLINKILGETDNQISGSSNSLSLINSNNISIYNNLSESESTCDETKSYTINNYPDDFLHSFRLIINEQKLNPARANFCLRKKLNDITYTQKKYEINQPPKYKINNECFIFIYPNLTITHCFALSELLKSDKLNFGNLLVDESAINDSTYNKQLGLFFCDLEDDIGNGTKKKCSPDQFMCRKCMNINKKLYHLKKHYLINIIGRACKINKGSFHCFGQFLVNNQIEDCITNFTCEGCKLLNLYSKYYLFER
jgi:hypothetical protein